MSRVSEVVALLETKLTKQKICLVSTHLQRNPEDPTQAQWDLHEFAIRAATKSVSFTIYQCFHMQFSDLQWRTCCEPGRLARPPAVATPGSRR